MAGRTRPRQYVVCVGNRGYRVSLVVRRLYECLPDPEAEAHKMLRVVDESGEDYLYPAKLFVPIEVPKAVGKAFAAAT
ncbi:MAG: hypothetical protein ABFC96_08970 [Thermoguttaceae bacterium]